MTKAQTVIKVFRKERTPRAPLYSAIATRQGIQMRYLRRKVNRAPDGRPYLAFNGMEAAKTFVSFHHSQMQRLTFDANGGWSSRYEPEIWECEATGVKRQHRVAWNWDSLKSIEAFWADEDRARHLSSVAPPGTVSCQTIKLVRKVDG